jgi:hypothetical protein
MFQHERHEGFSDEAWDRLTGGLGLVCPLCRGTGATASVPGADMAVLFCSTKDGKVLAACNSPECRKWVDATVFFKTADLKSRPWPKPFLGKCPNGHELKIEVSG